MIRPTERSLLLTGFLATLSGVGLARFAYTALMPEMVLAGWFSGEQVAYLGAANLLGYLLGAVAAASLAERWGSLRILVLCWAAVTISFAACSVPQPMPMFFVWRVVSGIAGASLMVLGPSLAMAATPIERRATLGPLMFCGIGAGALLSATLVPLLAQQSLSAVWWCLTLVCAAAWYGGWRSARQLPPPVTVPVAVSGAGREHAFSATAVRWSVPVLLVFAAYGCDAFGFVPHTVFWADYLARELSMGSAYASSQWAFFGLGALLGPGCAAVCATRWGWWRTTTGAYALKATAIGLPLMLGGFAGHAISSFIVGALSPGMAAITSGYLMQLIGPARHKHMWGYATAVFALLQATAGYAMAYRYASTGSYRSLFLWGCIALLLGTALVFFSKPKQPPSIHQ